MQPALSPEIRNLNDFAQLPREHQLFGSIQRFNDSTLMTLPNYFLADLPPGATLTAETISQACQTLKENRERYLAPRSTQSLVNTLCEVAANWLNPDYPIRQMTLANGPSLTGFSVEVLRGGIDQFFAQFTPENFHALLLQELGHTQRLDGLQSNREEESAHRASMVRGPELLVHFAGGALPNPPWMSIVLGLLTRSAQFVKCASACSFLPRMFVHSIYEVEPKFGACLEIAEWKGGTQTIEQALFAEADCLTATGDDETLSAIRSRLPQKVRFLGYGHKVSFGFITHESLRSSKELLARAADDVVAWNQLGCLSPHLFYVELGGDISPEEFGERLATELQNREASHPRGQLATEESAAIASRRAFYEVRAAHSRETRLWASSGSTAWTVVFEANPRFQASCLNRFIYIKAVTGLEQALQGADAVRAKVSAVGLAAPEDRARQLATQLAQWGVTRICPLGKMQNPPLTWRHDGRPVLADLLTWTDWEQR